MEALFWLVYIGVIVAIIAGVWMTFQKAGQPGWAAIIPIYNTYIMIKIAGKEWWWLLLLLIPLVNIAVWIVLSLAIAAKFRKGTGFGIGLAFLPFIFFCILGFGDATYDESAATV